jgi:hypothetical protein
LERWRAAGVNTTEMLETERKMSQWALETIQRAYEYLIRFD